MTALTSGMILEIEDFKAKLPSLSERDKAYILGLKVALETTVPADGSWERGMLSRLIQQHAWMLAYRDYVQRCLDQCGEPVSYEDWRPLTEARQVRTT